MIIIKKDIFFFCVFFAMAFSNNSALMADNDTAKSLSIDQKKEISIYINPRNHDTKNNLVEIERYYNLTWLTIRGIYLDEVDYAPLLTLENLKNITIISSSNIDNENQVLSRVPDFPILPSVEFLEIINHEFKNLKGIEKFQNLEYLIIENLTLHNIPNHISEKIENLKSLSELQKLKSLTIRDNGESHILVSDLDGLSELKEFNIPWGYVIDFTGVEKLLNLEVVSIGVNTNTVNIEAIKDLKHLKVLKIPLQNHVKSLDFLKNIISLEILSLSNASYPENVLASNAMRNDNDARRLLDINQLNHLVNLRNLILTGFNIKNIVLVNEMENLNLLGLESCSFTPSESNTLINPHVDIYYGYEH
jgi:hypothetical protein